MKFRIAGAAGEMRVTKKIVKDHSPIGEGDAMSASCGHCGARSTIWSPTCVFCSHPVSPSSPRIRVAVFETPAGPCTERREAERKGTWVDGLRDFCSRVFQRLAPTRP